MSNTAAGGGGGVRGGGCSINTKTKTRVSSSIPNNVRVTVESIKEIASKHSEDGIYAMLKECSMDPHQTTQRLLFLDTFHEVKNKRDKRNENMKSRPLGESRRKPAYQGRGSQGARGSSYLQYSSYDSRGQRNAPTRKENVAGETKEKGFRPSSVTLNGPMKVPNGSLSGGLEAQSSGVGDTNLLREKATADSDKSQVPPKGTAEPFSCAVSQMPAAVGAIKREVQIPKISSELNDPIPTDREQDTAESIRCIHLNEQEPVIVNKSRTSLPMLEEVTCGHFNVAQPQISGQGPPGEKVSVVRSCSPQGMKEATSRIEKLKVSDGQHVIIPSHIQVPDAVKNLLIFGSFGVGESHSNSESDAESNSAAAEVHDETTSKSSSCEEDDVPAVTDREHVDQPQAPVHLPERNSPSEPEVLSSATVPKGDQMKEDNLPAVGHPPFPVVQTAPNYSFGFMPPLLVDPHVQPPIFEHLVHVSNSEAGGSPPMTTSPSAPPPVQTVGAGQNSIAPSPSPIALFRQSYPPNYVPYSHYYPFYPPPIVHQYFGHTAFPTLPPGNIYLPPPVVAAGMNVSPSSYKSGANTGNQTPVGLPSVDSAYNSAQVSFSPSASVTSVNSIGSADTVPSLKGNSTYLGRQSEGSTLWVPDAASFPLNAFVNLTSPGQHLINSQSGPSGFVYHALKPPMATPAPSLTLLQQSQPMTGSIKSVRPHPPVVCQQPQCQQ